MYWNYNCALEKHCSLETKVSEPAALLSYWNWKQNFCQWSQFHFHPWIPGPTYSGCGETAPVKLSDSKQGALCIWSCEKESLPQSVVSHVAHELFHLWARSAASEWWWCDKTAIAETHSIVHFLLHEVAEGSICECTDGGASRSLISRKGNPHAEWSLSSEEDSKHGRGHFCCIFVSSAPWVMLGTGCTGW
jgi:hypothetical protein